jgi:DNA-binding NtrC family response regulator
MQESGSNKRVLVVDDEEAIRNGIARVLTMHKLKVDTASGGLQALEMVARQPYTVVLLRVIQEREFMQVGSQKRIKLDIRIIASSNRDLSEAVKASQFREDLFYRLSVIPLPLPPLRERIGDIPLLVAHFLRKYCEKGNRKISGIAPAAMKLLSSYAWPGNVRQLEHTIESIVILEDGDVILPEHLPSFISQRQGEFQLLSGEEISLEDLEKHHIQFVLRRTKGHRQDAARILGINRKTLSHKIEKYRLRANW